MARENFKNIAIGLFGELPGIFTPGLNGEQEFLDSLVSNLEHVNEMKSIINLSTIKEADRYLEYAKKMNIILGENIFSLGPNIKPVELYISRIYDNIHGGNGIVFNQKITNLEDYTIDADVSRRTISDNIPGVYSVTVLNGKGRANSYADYDSLTNKDKLLLKQQLRKKVMAHEFNHLSVTSRNLMYDLVEFEEIAVERMALKALNINGKSNIKRGNYYQSLPNIESSRSAVYASGELLSKILGEEEFQLARLKGDLSEFIKNKIGEDVKKLNSYLMSCNDDSIAKLNGFANRLSAQLVMEEILLGKYAKKVQSELIGQRESLDIAYMFSKYKECKELYTMILKHQNPLERENMNSVKILKGLVSELDKVIERYHMDVESFKKKVNDEMNSQNSIVNVKSKN